MQQKTHLFEIDTTGTGVTQITGLLREWLQETGIEEGLLTLHIQHTSASLLIQENADPEVMRDMERFFQEIVPYGHRIFRHTAEGPDDMPAHVRSALTQTSLSIPVVSGQLGLGTWQGIYVYEHRQRPHRRCVLAHLLGAKGGEEKDAHLG